MPGTTALQKHALDWPAGVILLAFVALGTLYSMVDPVFEASDEINHYPYVRHVAQGHGLPVQEPSKESLWDQEGSQPPLYYALSAALTFWIDTDDLPTVLRVNPHAQKGIPLAPDNKNMAVHTDAEAFPWRGTYLAVHIIRFFSVLLGAGTVTCTYLLARYLFPDRPAMAYCAMAANAFLPMFLFISGSVNNDNLVVLLSSVTLLLLVRVVQCGARPGRLVLLGILIGLACLSKLSALGLLALAALALALRQIQDMHLSHRLPARSVQPWGEAIRRWTISYLLVLLPAALVAGWWYVRNWRLYGDPLGLNAMLDIAGRRAQPPSLVDLLGEFQGFRINFWGLFGGVNVLMRPDWVYKALDALTVLALLGLFLWIWRSGRRQGVAAWSPLLLVAAWMGIESVALVRWTSVTLASQGRLLFPAISAICVMLALGWTQGWSRWLGRAAAWGIGGFLFVLAATAPFTAIRPAYAQPPVLSAADVPASARRIDLDFGGSIRLLALETDRQRVSPGSTLVATLYWQALAPIREDYSVGLQLFGWHQLLAQKDSYPGGGMLSTSLWSPGQVIRDTYLLTVPMDARGPAPAWVSASLYQLATMERLPVTDERDQPVSLPVLAKIALDVPDRSMVPSQALDANLEDRVRLIGFDQDGAAQPGKDLAVTLYWEVTGKLGRDFSVFVHLVDQNDRIVTQGDGQPLQGFYPTSHWSKGEILNDTHTMRLPEDLTPGNYRILAGLYHPETGERLSVLDVAGNPAGTAVLVSTITLGR